MPKLLSALAATISSCRTVRGSSASREGRWSADADASRPETRKISHRRGWEEKALMASQAVKAAWAMPVQISRSRRSTWSASAPPYRPKTMSGTSSTRPTAPTARLEPVIV